MNMICQNQIFSFHKVVEIFSFHNKNNKTRYFLPFSNKIFSFNKRTRYFRNRRIFSIFTCFVFSKYFPFFVQIFADKQKTMRVTLCNSYEFFEIRIQLTFANLQDTVKKRSTNPTQVDSLWLEWIETPSIEGLVTHKYYYMNNIL